MGLAPCPVGTAGGAIAGAGGSIAGAGGAVAGAEETGGAHGFGRPATQEFLDMWPPRAWCVLHTTPQRGHGKTSGLAGWGGGGGRGPGFGAPLFEAMTNDCLRRPERSPRARAGL